MSSYSPPPDIPTLRVSVDLGFLRCVHQSKSSTVVKHTPCDFNPRGVEAITIMQSEEGFFSPNVQLHGANSTATPLANDIFGDLLSSEPFNLSDFLLLDVDESLWVQGDIQNRHPNGIHINTDPPQSGICPNSANDDSISKNHRTSLPSASRPPAVNGRSKSESLTESEWEAIFDIVFPLYLKKSLTEILRLLKINGNVCPSRKQLKTKIQLWHEQARLPHKNIDKSDMDYMVLVAHLRGNQGLKTAFKHYGFLVHGSKLEKHRQRWGVNFKELNPEVSPEHITWDAPLDQSKSPISSSALQHSCETPQNYSPPSAPTNQTMMTPDSGPFKDVFVQGVVEYMDEVNNPKDVHMVSGQHDQSPGTSLCFTPGHGETPGTMHLETENKSGKEDFPRSWVPPSPESLQGSPSGNNCVAKPNSLQAHKRPRKFDENDQRHTVREQKNQPKTQYTKHKSSPPAQYPTNIAHVDQNKYELPLEPERRKITTAQLAQEVKSIYTGLTMVESKCIHVGTMLLSQSQENVSIAPDKWIALIGLHRTLLHEHHDFLLASQHPNASPALRRLANKYSMHARMFKHGCLGLLELMRKNLPHSLDYMITFIEGIAYPMFVLIFETVPAFKEFWTEILGDLARYRMAIEECDPRYREIWSVTSRSWYRHAQSLEPGIGRIQHSLGILSTPDDFQMLSFFSKSLTSEENFPPGRDTMLSRLKSTPPRFSNKTKDLQLAFRNMHLALYTEDFATAHSMTSGFYSSATLTQLRSLSYQQGFEFAIINITSLFNYGNQSPLRYMFELANHLSSKSDLMIDEEMTIPPHLKEPLLAGISDITYQAICCKFVFSTLTMFLQLEDFSDAVGHILALLTFLCSLEKASKVTSVLLQSSMFMVQQIFTQVPWELLCSFLNKEPFQEVRRDQALRFPGFNQSEEQPLPEDWDIRGLIWTAGHFPTTWFDDKRELETEDLKHGDLRKSRLHRVIYLARALCISGYMSFEDGLFSEVSDLPINRTSTSIYESKQEEVFNSHSQLLGCDQVSCPSSDTASSYPWSTPNTTEASSTSPSSLDYQFPDDK